MKKSTFGLALGLATSGLLSISSVFAADADSAPASDSARPNEEGGLQEVTVTAERRSERLQDVPIAVAVVSASDAQKMGNIDNLSLSTQVPGLNVSRQLTGATIYLRGVGTIAAPGNENAVATYIDDVYVNGFSATIVPFNNIDHVEVLKGPQGTLFGRNATGGVISITTKEPSLTPALNVQLGYANYDTYSASLYGTIPLTGNLAVDLSYNGRDQRKGFGYDLTTGQQIWKGKEYGVRSKLKWTPDDRTSVVVGVDHYYDNYDYALNANVMPGTLSAGLATFVGNYNSQADNAFSGGAVGHGRRINGVTLTAQHEFGWGTLKNISGRRDVVDSAGYDQDLGPLHVVDSLQNSHLEMYSEELHLSSTEGFQLAGRDFHWLAGLYVFKMNDAMRPLELAGSVLGGLQLLNATSESYTRSYAGFLDGTYAVTPTMNLTLGVRYTDDRIINYGNAFIVFPGGGTANIPAPNQYSNSKRPTYRVVLDQKITPDAMVYASASSGFKSGGFALFAEGTPPVRPETIHALALGLKSEWLQKRLQVNLEAYHYDYLNQQVEVIINAGAYNINAARSKIHGLDVNLVGLVTEDLTLRANFGYLHGRYDTFKNAPEYIQLPATCSPVPMRLPGPLQPGNLQCAVDASGKPTTRSPEFSGNVSGDYVFRTGIGNIDLAANYFYTTKYNWDPSGQYPEPAYGLLNSSLGWMSPDSKWNIQVFCSNCTDKYHDTFIAESGPSIQRAGTEPRTYGVRFGVNL